MACTCPQLRTKDDVTMLQRNITVDVEPTPAETCPSCKRPLAIYPVNDVYEYRCSNGGCQLFPTSGSWSTPELAKAGFDRRHRKADEGLHSESEVLK